MKNKIRSVLLLFIAVGISVARGNPVAESTPDQAEAYIMTFNIRYDNKNDGINKWDKRKKKVVQTIIDNNVDIVGIQEATYKQINYLNRELTDYEWIGIARDDGLRKGEYVPIFYNTKKFSRLEYGFFWLSENPGEIGSIGWDAACRRVATWAKLMDIRTGKIIFAINTHFDHIGETARRKSAKLILQEIEAQTKETPYPVIVTGDFNVTPDSEIIKIMTDKNGAYYLTNARNVSPQIKGPEWSFHAFGQLPVQQRVLIDYIFIKNDISVLEYEIIAGAEKHKFVSDHCPALVKVRY